MDKLLKAFWVLSALLLATRLLFITSTMVLDDEAYYLMYARHLDWGYVDHGPVIAYLIRIFTAIFGENGFGIRFGAVAMITILNVALYRFGRQYFSTVTGVTLALTVTAGMLTHMNGVIMTPDAPLAFFTILAIMVYYRAFFDNPKHFWGAGALLGLGIFSKISAVFPAFGIFLFPFVSRRHRSFLKEPRFYASFVVALFVMLPFIIWNFRHDFAFLRYQGAHVAGGGNIATFLELWAGIMLLGGPVFFVYGVAQPLAFVARARFRRDEGWRSFFSVVAFVPLIYFIAHSLFSRMELNWPAPALFGGIFLFGITVGEAWPGMRRRFQFQIGYSLLLIAIITIHTLVPVLPLRNKNDITDRYYDYKAFRGDFSKFIEANPEVAGLRVAANNYQFPSMINLYQEPALEATCLSIGYHPTLYGFIHGDLSGEDFLLIIDGTKFPSALRPHFTSVSPLGELQSKRYGHTVRTFTLWRGDGYRGRVAQHP